MITIFGTTINIYAIIIGVVILAVLYGLKKSQDDPESPFDWTDMVTAIDQVTGQRRASVSKIMQIVGGITGTFIVVMLTLNNNIHFEIFATYLAYVASVEGFSKLLKAKYGAGQNNNGGNYGGGNYGGGNYGGGNYGGQGQDQNYGFEQNQPEQWRPGQPQPKPFED